MKRLLHFFAVSSILISPSCRQKVDSSRPALQLTLASHGNNELHVCLKNVGRNSIKVRVNKKEFEGYFKNYKDGAIVSRAYPEKFWNLMVKGVWENPMHIMQRGEEICWQVSTAALIHKDSESRNQAEVLGDIIVAVCETLYVQGVGEMEKVDLSSNMIKVKETR